MCTWDTLWAKYQVKAGFRALLFDCYVDDLRLFVFPINPGWTSTDNGWIYDQNHQDQNTDLDRMRGELNKSFDIVIDCLFFTTESQKDFDSRTLPTLDVQTETECNGVIQFKHFTKPMCNNILLEKGINWFWT